MLCFALKSTALTHSYSLVLAPVLSGLLVALRDGRLADAVHLAEVRLHAQELEKYAAAGNAMLPPLDPIWVWVATALLPLAGLLSLRPMQRLLARDEAAAADRDQGHHDNVEDVAAPAAEMN